MKKSLLCAILAASAAFQTQAGDLTGEYTATPNPDQPLLYLAQVNVEFPQATRIETLDYSMFDPSSAPAWLRNDATGQRYTTVGCMPPFGNLIQFQFYKDLRSRQYLEEMGMEPGEEMLPYEELGFYTLVVPAGLFNIVDADGVAEQNPQLEITYNLNDPTQAAVKSMGGEGREAVIVSIDGRILEEVPEKGIYVSNGKLHLK